MAKEDQPAAKITQAEAEAGTILKVLVGSHIHGLNVGPTPCKGCATSPIAGTVFIKQSIDDGMGSEMECEGCKGTGYSHPGSDKDIECVVIEPYESIVRLGRPFEDLVIETPECDTKYVSLRKWCGLALNGNPNFLLPLFAPSQFILNGDSRGRTLQSMSSAFVSRKAGKSHLGYMNNQRKRLLNHIGQTYLDEVVSNGGHGRPRDTLVEQFGWDTKFGMHLLRLAMQGVEFLKTGHVTLPMAEVARTYLLRVRAGDVPVGEVLKEAERLENEMVGLLETTSLPREPKWREVEEFMQNLYFAQWSSDQRHKGILRAQHIRDSFGAGPLPEFMVATEGLPEA